MGISIDELSSDSDSSLYLSDIYNIKELIYKNQYYKFFILNIEYNVNKEEALNIIATDIHSKKLSISALEQLIKREL